MLRYVLKRLLLLIPVILGSAFIIFSIMDFAPGDITDVLAAEADEQTVEQLKEELGLNKPLVIQYLNYVKKLLRGNLGTSNYNKNSVFSEFMAKFPNTLKLAGWGLVVGILISIPIGILSAVKQYSLWDDAGMIVALVGVSMPAFWEALLLILLFSLKLDWFPSGGNELPFAIVLPAITTGTRMAATITRMTRSSMLEVVRQDYISTARAKGLSEKKVIFNHAFRNALIPVVTTAGISFGNSIGGAVVTETVFSWPGVGKLVVESIGRRDTPMVLGCIVLITICISVVNLLVDLLYAFIDPRIKAQYKKTR